jgi:hypothetical protein
MDGQKGEFGQQLLKAKLALNRWIVFDRIVKTRAATSRAAMTAHSGSGLGVVVNSHNKF